jgi:hypothetical protein
MWVLQGSPTLIKTAYPIALKLQALNTPYPRARTGHRFWPLLYGRRQGTSPCKRPFSGKTNVFPETAKQHFGSMKNLVNHIQRCILYTKYFELLNLNLWRVRRHAKASKKRTKIDQICLFLACFN